MSGPSYVPPVSSGAMAQAAADDPDGWLPWRSAALYVILATALVIPLDVPFVSPALPVIEGAFGVSEARASLLITAFSAPGAVFTILLGIAADRLGRRTVLVPCLALYGLFGASIALVGVSGASVPLVDDFTVVLALRFLQGVTGGGILASLALTLVGDFFSGTRRNAVMGVTTGTTAFAAAFYPALGGALAEIDWYLPFAVYVAALPVSALAFLALDEPEVDRSVTSGLAYFRDALAAVPGRIAGLLYGATLASGVVIFGGVLAGVTFMLSNVYELSPGRIGLFVTVPLLTTAVFSATNGWFAARASNRTLLATGFVGYGLGLAGTWAAASPNGVLVALFVVGAGHGLVLPTIPSELSALAPGRFRSGALSVRTSLYLVGQALGPPLFTVPAAALGYTIPLLAAGVVTGVAGVLALLALRRA